MVHGAGACSSGFSSGGGFGSTSALIGGSSSRRQRIDIRCDNKCAKWCLCLCELFCFFFDCRKQSLRNRVIIFWVWLAFIASVSGLIVGLGQFGSHNMDASVTDMRQVENGRNTDFCDGFTVTSNIPIDVYLLAGKPSILTSNKTSFYLNKATYISRGNYEYWGYYLLPGSKVQIKSCVAYSSTLYIIQGHYDLNHWKTDNDCYNCYLQSYTTSDCSKPDFSDVFSIDISEADEYYFVWANPDGATTSLNVTFNLERTFYDVKSTLYKCIDKDRCEISYSEMYSDETILYYVPQSIYDTDDVTVTATCERRHWLFVVIFFVTPISFGIFVTFILYLRFKNRLFTNKGQPTPFENQAMNAPITHQPPPYSSLNTGYNTYDQRGYNTAYGVKA